MTGLAQPQPGFAHEAFLYEDDQEYLDRTSSFVEAGLEAGEPALVAVPLHKHDLLRERLGEPDGTMLQLVAMEEMGRNPAWIIPAWADFVYPHLAAGGRARGVGEPIWQDRSVDELIECGRHESLLNLAFADAGGFTLMCPYDASVLPTAVTHEALRTHPTVTVGGNTIRSDHFDSDVPQQLDTPLSPVPDGATTVDFDVTSLAAVRHLTGRLGRTAGLPQSRVDALLLAVSEVTTNSVRHAGGGGQLACWLEHDRFVCEVRDKGRISDPLAGRVRPHVAHHGGRGLWLMHQLCDLVQVRVLDDRQVIRLHLSA